MAAIGKNIDVVVKDGKAIITVDLAKDFGRSSSGKSIIIASSEGNAELPGAPGIKLGLNIYKKG
ncbi:MAG: hypothetical protein IPO81_00200 [Kouleothrix sp.]|nr:hypothetical protein [Kouleothrix sp.]